MSSQSEASVIEIVTNDRLGRLPSIPVDWNELNTAWGQTVLLLYSLVKKIKLQLQRYKLGNRWYNGTTKALSSYF